MSSPCQTARVPPLNKYPCTRPASVVGSERSSVAGQSAMPEKPKAPAWVIRQGVVCVWVEAMTEAAAVELAVNRLGHLGGWKVGPDVDQEVFAAKEYRNHAKPGDYTRSVIIDSQGS